MQKQIQLILALSALIFAASIAYYFVYYIPKQKQLSDTTKYLQLANNECQKIIDDTLENRSKLASSSYKLETYQGNDPQTLKLKSDWMEAEQTLNYILANRQEWTTGCVGNKLRSWGLETEQ